MKSIVDDLVVTCDEIVVTPETALIKSNDKTVYWLTIVVFAVVLLAIVNSVLLVVIVIKC